MRPGSLNLGTPQLLLIHQPALAPGTDATSSAHPSPLDPPAALGAAEAISGGTPRGRSDRLIVITSRGIGADLAARGFPLVPMPILRRQRMRYLVQDRIAHLGRFVQKRERARKSDRFCRIPARAKPPSGMIEAEAPACQPMLGHQLARKQHRIMRVHRIFLNQMKPDRRFT